MEEQNFEYYMIAVDSVLSDAIGLGHRDIDDAPYWSMFEDSVSPCDAAATGLAHAEAPDELIEDTYDLVGSYQWQIEGETISTGHKGIIARFPDSRDGMKSTFAYIQGLKDAKAPDRRYKLLFKRKR